VLVFLSSSSLSKDQCYAITFCDLSLSSHIYCSKLILSRAYAVVGLSERGAAGFVASIPDIISARLGRRRIAWSGRGIGIGTICTGIGIGCAACAWARP
jgi:hypothetical protein